GADAVIFAAHRGQSSLAYRGLFVTDARGRRLPASIALTPGRLLMHVSDAGARYPLTIDPFVQQARLTAWDRTQSDSFGASLAVVGDAIVAGAPGAMVGANASQGAAYVLVKPPSGWATATETARLTASDGTVNDNLGASVAVSGDTIVVGAPVFGR